MKRTVSTILCVLFSSCSLFSADTEPAVAALTEIERVTARVQARAAAITEKITDPAARAVMEAGFTADFEALARLRQSVLDWTASVGDVNWQELYRKVKEIAGD